MDAHLEDLVAQASAACEGFCGRSFARVAVVETFFRASYPLVLTNTPIVSIDELVDCGSAVPAGSFATDLQNGIIYRDWYSGGFQVAVTYTAGFLLPGQEGRNLPADVERACLEVIKALWFSGGAGARDPRLRSESVEGIGSTSYLDPSAASGGLPDTAAALLRPHQRLGL